MVRLIVVMMLTISCVYAQVRKVPVKTVTVTGCIDQGVECFVLRDSTGKQDYSIARSGQLKVGHAYRITGPVSDIGFCQEGKPILGPEKVVEVKMGCQQERPSKQQK